MAISRRSSDRQPLVRTAPNNAFQPIFFFLKSVFNQPLGKLGVGGLLMTNHLLMAGNGGDPSQAATARMRLCALARCCTPAYPLH
jgi:hypothetical protein